MDPDRLCYANQVVDSSRESGEIAGGHEQADTPTYKIKYGTAYNEALKRHGSSTIQLP
ncbi:hypothetical protein NBRC116599_23480 [Aquicoccus sp. SU-CL01552]